MVRRSSERSGGPSGGPASSVPAPAVQRAPAAPWAPAEPKRAAPSGQAGDPEAVARQICLRMLTTAPRTRAQLAEALRRRGVPAEAAEAVLGRFGEVKLIDDAAFAAAWVESRHYGRGLSSRALAAELTHRGVPPEDIEAAVGQLDPRQEIATAHGLVARRLASTRGQPLNARIRRLTGMLARKGYSPAIAYRVVREALEHEAAGAGRAAGYLADMEEPHGDEELEGFEASGEF